MKLAIVHDYLNQAGGAENVVEVLHQMYPDAPVFTTIFQPERLPPAFRTMDVRTSFMQRLPFMEKHYKKYVPIYPVAVESLDLSGFDVVLSSSSAFAKGVRVPKGALHICYCYTPMRFVWNRESYFSKEKVALAWRPLLPPVLSYLKAWDLRTAPGVHHFVAISEFIRKRIAEAYRRDAEVIYPPVETARFAVSEDHDDYFLVVSRLNAYKNIDIMVEAFNRTPHRLLIAGTGPEEPRLRRMAGERVSFLGRVPDADLPRLLSRCRAFVFPGEEDFGIAPLEAMASGRPVIALERGGALETMLDGTTGVFFREPTAESFLHALERFGAMSFDPERVRAHALKFDTSVFVQRLGRFIRERYEGFRSAPPRS